MIHRDFHRQRMETFLRGQLAEGSEQREERFSPALTISRQCGSGTSRIGRALVEYLDGVDESAVHGWAFFDQSLIGKLIEENRLPLAEESYEAGRAGIAITELLEQALSLPQSEWNLFTYSAFTIRKLCKLGNAVVVGRAGNFVTADLDNTFRVRLVGSEANRIAYTRARFQLTNGEAEKLVRKTDQARSRFVRRFTGMDIDSAEAYHLVLNTDTLPDEVIVRIIGDSLTEWASERFQRRFSPANVSNATPRRTLS